MMLPLAAKRGGDQWPNTMPLTLDDGTELIGHVAWMEAAPRRDVIGWTDDPRRLAIRPITPSDDSTSSLGAPYLLVELPAFGDGSIRLIDQALTPIWSDVPRSIAELAPPGEAILEPQEVIPFLNQPDRPDITSPFEYWRWVLLAEKLHMIPPPPQVFDHIGSLTARHYLDLCRIALGRLALASPGVARGCRDHLVRICTDRGEPFAAWIADPSEVNRLLTYLLDFSRRPERLLAAALPWADWNSRLLVWPESASGDQVRLAAVNPGYERTIMTLTWRGGDGVPIGVALDPGVLTRVRIDRPIIEQPTIAGLRAAPVADEHILEIKAGGRQWQMQFSARRFSAAPPGVFLNPLSRPLTLIEVQRQSRMQQMGEDRATFVSVRKRSGRWEIFAECHRPPSDSNFAQPQNPLESCAGYADTLGVESITLLMGSAADGNEVVLSIPERGWHRLFTGENDGTLQVHRRSYEDRWYCRVVLPRGWVADNRDETAGPIGEAGRLTLGCVRTHGGSSIFESGPGSPLPWAMEPARIDIDLTTWEDRPSLENTTP